MFVMFFEFIEWIKNLKFVPPSPSQIFKNKSRISDLPTADFGEPIH